MAVVGCLVLVRVLVRRLASSSPSVSLPAQVFVLALVFVAGTWHWSDVPWSHFYAAALAVAFYVVRLLPERRGLLVSASTGAVLALLALTRSFEFMGVVVGWGLVAGLFAALSLRGARSWRPAGLAVGAAAFAATTAAVYPATGKRNSFLLYASDDGVEYSDLLSEEMADLPTFDFGLVPVKSAQIFLDPCFYSLCRFHEYAGIREAWRQPLAIQLPALLLVPLCVRRAGGPRGASGEAAASARQARVRELRFLVELTVVAAGLTFGYVASTWSSSSGLRFGFARDFLLPFFLAAVVAAVLLFVGVDAGARRGWLRVGERRMSAGVACTVTARARRGGC